MQLYKIEDCIEIFYRFKRKEPTKCLLENQLGLIIKELNDYKIWYEEENII